VAPCPVPYAIGGAENLWRGLQDHLNERTPHQAEIIKLPTREFAFWDLVDSYRAFAELDLEGFDVVVTGKYPAWMVEHPRHVCWMLHPLRGLYETYVFFDLPEVPSDPPADVRALLELLEARPGDRSALGEVFERLDALRRAGLPAELTAFPGPLIRVLVHWFDGVALHPDRVARHGAISATVRDRPGYFPDGVEVFVAHPPTSAPVAAARRRGRLPWRRDGGYLFTVSRLDHAKRIELLIEAMRHVDAGVELRIAGTGPHEERLRELAAGDPRVRFCGRVPGEELGRLYAGARAVGFVPYDEDFGYVTLEAMLTGCPVVTVSDAGGARELVSDGETGLVVDPAPEAVAGALERLWRDPAAARRMGEAARRRAQQVSWDPVVAELEAVAA